MILLQNPTDLQTSAIELHYYFNDETHTMDAVVQNDCEYYFLAIIKTISTTLDVEIIVETEPLADGGLKRIFKILEKNEIKKGTITAAIVTALLTALIVTPITTTISHSFEKLVDKAFEDKELVRLTKDKTRAEIENIKADTKLKCLQLAKDTGVVKKRSDFYDTLDKYPKVEKLGVIDYHEPTTQHYVDRAKFKEYILATNKLEPTTVDGAVIEIISPVLKKGNYKWRGIYEGEVVSFNMKSNEFKAMVQKGEVDFKNGFTINCQLQMENELNSEGEKEVTEYNILRVNEYYFNDKPIETPEGKKHRQIVEADRKQLKIFPTDDDPQ